MAKGQKALLFFSLVSSYLLGASFYFEFVRGLAPCPLCIMQRLCLMLIVFFLGCALLIKRFVLRLIVIELAVLFCFAGAYFSGRQVYLQHLPKENVPACGPGLDFMLKYFGTNDLLQALFLGTGSCAKPSWHWLGVSMAEWALAAFIGLTAGLMALQMALLLQRKRAN